MKGWVLLLMLLVACAQPSVQPLEAEEKVVEVVEKVIVQCWDGSTASSLENCPKEEKIMAKEVVAPEPKAAEAVPIAKQLLAEAQKHAGYAYELEDRFVLISGDKARHLFSEKLIFVERKPFSDVFVDLAGKTAMAYCNVEHEEQMLDNAFTWSVSDCKHFIDNSTLMPFEKWVPKGPLDYLKDFADVEPDFVEEADQTVSIAGVPKTVRPSIHYVVNGVRVVLRIDQRNKVPIQIEIQGQQPISFRNVYFDNVPLYDGQEKITDLLEYKPVSQVWLKENAQ